MKMRINNREVDVISARILSNEDIGGEILSTVEFEILDLPFVASDFDRVVFTNNNDAA